MQEDAQTFLSKAQENLQAAQSLFDHKLYNASANRAYYAAFQAAVAALLAESLITPERLGHDIVQARFVGDLINRRKKYPASLRSSLADMRVVREDADYSVKLISEKKSKEQLRLSKEFVEQITKRIQAC